MAGRRAFIDLLKDIARDEGLEILLHSRDWIVQLSRKNGPITSIFGYTFDINGGSAMEICREKSATAIVLESRGVPCIPHTVYLNPGSSLISDYLPSDSTVFADIIEEAAKYEYQVVLKPLKGTGGNQVLRCRNTRDIEAGAMCIFQKEHGLALSPYFELEHEYRAVCFDGEVRMLYRKDRGGVIGDGKRTLRELSVDAFLSAPKPADFAAAIAEMGEDMLQKVPAAGECVAVQWRHNLGRGASASFDVPSDTRQEVSDLAKRAVAALGAGCVFCSVDIVTVAGSGDMMVMEVNAGVMMDNLLRQQRESDVGGVTGYQLAKDIYTEAILRGLRS